MANFNEHALEMSIMQLFKEEGYEYISGEQIHRERTDVLLTDDLKQYLYARYAKDGITPSEVDSIILMLRNTSGTLYEANKTIYKMLCDGFIFNREDRTQKDTMTESVRDGITVNLVYDGRAARVTLDQAKIQEIEDYYAKCENDGANEHQVEESKKAVANMEIIIGDPDRLRAVAQDFIEHYENRVEEGATVAGKAMFVCANRKKILSRIWALTMRKKPSMTFLTSLLANMSLNILMIK